MHFQFDVPPTKVASTGPAAIADPAAGETIGLLRQLLEVQREQLALARQAAASADHNARWKAFLQRWSEDFPGLPASCRAVVPQLERAYVTLVNDLAERVQGGDTDLDNEFALNEFLDRFGLRLSQLGSVLSLVAVLAEAAGPAGESA